MENTFQPCRNDQRKYRRVEIMFNSSSSIYEFLLEKGTAHIIIRHALAVLNFVSKC
jgi:hypothetical protein